MRKSCEVLPLDPIDQVHFVLAGRTGKTPEDPYRLYLIWTKESFAASIASRTFVCLSFRSKLP